MPIKLKLAFAPSIEYQKCYVYMHISPNACSPEPSTPAPFHVPTPNVSLRPINIGYQKLFVNDELKAFYANDALQVE